MPQVRTEGTTDEEIEEWLGRIEEYEILPDERTLFQETLRSELYGLNERQIDVLWEAKQVQTDYAEHGIRAVIFRFDWGSDIRYFVQGLIGPYGWESIKLIREEEEW